MQKFLFLSVFASLVSILILYLINLVLIKRFLKEQEKIRFLLLSSIFFIISFILLTINLRYENNLNRDIELVRLYFIQLCYISSVSFMEFSLDLSILKKTFLYDDFRKKLPPLVYCYGILIILLFFPAIIEKLFPVDVFTDLELYNGYLFSIFFLLIYGSIYRIFSVLPVSVQKKRISLHLSILITFVTQISQLFYKQNRSLLILIYVLFMNLIIIMILSKDFILIAFKKAQETIKDLEESEKKSQTLVKDTIKKNRQEIYKTLQKLIQAFIDTTKQRGYIPEYGITGAALYRNNNNVLTVEDENLILGYSTPFTDQSQVRLSDRSVLKDSIQKEVYSIDIIKKTDIKDLKHFGKKCFKKILESQEPLLINKMPPFLKGQQRFIGFFPIIERKEIYGILILFKDSFNKLLPEEEKEITKLLNSLAIILAIMEGKDYQTEHSRLEHEMDVARKIQTSILPQDLQINGYDCAAVMHTASEVGGDTYDCIPRKDGCYLGIGDVSGHGLPSGLTALIQAVAFYTSVLTSDESDRELPVDRIYSIVNKILCIMNRDRIGSDKFITQNYLRIKENQIQYAGSHEVALLYRKESGEVCELEGFVNRTGYMGVIDDLETEASRGELKLEQGDILLLYTDGLIEARSYHGQFYGLERLKSILQQDALKSSELIIDRIINDVSSFAETGDIKKNNGYFADDISIIIIKRKQQES